MGYIDHRFEIDESLGRIEQDVLPSVTQLLDALLDAAGNERGGDDSAVQLRAAAIEIDRVVREMAALYPRA